MRMHMKDYDEIPSVEDDEYTEDTLWKILNILTSTQYKLKYVLLTINQLIFLNDLNFVQNSDELLYLGMKIIWFEPRAR